MSRQKTKAKVLAPVDSQLGRINKVLAAAGLGSRRQVEELIVQGRVEVDGNLLTDLGTRVDPQTSKIKVDGILLKRPKLVYYALNKPKGVLSTNHDPSGRPRVVDFVPDRHRVFSVGRLDLHSEGLVLLTNDGTLAQRLAHPRFRVQKTYFVVVAGLMNPEELNQLRKGVYLAEGVARIDGARIRKARKGCTELEIQLSEGKNREIRRLLARADHKVVLLRRISIGPLRLGELPSGAARELTQQEVQSLYLCTTQQKKTKASVEKPQAARRVAGNRNRDEKLFDTEEAQERQKNTMHAGSQTLPLDQPATDDFGLGLDDDDSFLDEQTIPLEFQFSEESLKAMESELDESEDEDWDDDFATDFSALKSTGSVIGSEEESPPPKARKGAKSRPEVRRGAASPRTGQPRGAGAKKSGRSKSPSGNQRTESKRSTAAPKAARSFTKKKASSSTSASGISPSRNSQARNSRGSSSQAGSSRGGSSQASTSRGGSSQVGSPRGSSSQASRPPAKASRFKGSSAKGSGAKGAQSKRPAGKGSPKRAGGKKRSR